GRSYDSPERRAALDKALREKIKLIRDPSIRSHYGQAIKELRWQLFNPRRDGAGQAGRARWRKPEPVRTSTKTSFLAASGEQAQEQLREAVILATLIRTPDVCTDFEAELENMACLSPLHRQLRDLLLCHAGAGQETLEAHMNQEIGQQAVENLLSLPHVALVPAVRHAGDDELARMTVAETFAKIDADRGLAAEISEAEQDILGLVDEAVTWRLGEAAEARNRAWHSQQEDRTEYERGENGAPVSRSEKEKFAALLEQMGFAKRTDG
ncbi:MAG: DNA primase, partial [Rhodobacteraceae bacterium]|nr:DNA primase [Paracoccaceae bacterium]